MIGNGEELAAVDALAEKRDNSIEAPVAVTAEEAKRAEADAPVQKRACPPCCPPVCW